MTDTPGLALPRVRTAPERKHISYNRAVRTLVYLVQLTVINQGLTMPPTSPANGDQYIICIGANGGNFTGGKVRIAIHTLTCGVPLS